MVACCILVVAISVFVRPLISVPQQPGSQPFPTSAFKLAEFLGGQSAVISDYLNKYSSGTYLFSWCLRAVESLYVQTTCPVTEWSPVACHRDLSSRLSSPLST